MESNTNGKKDVRLWKAIYTRPRNEKKLAEQLTYGGFEVYLPLVKTVRQWKDRKKRLKVPMFTSYLFVKISKAQEFEMRDYVGFVAFVKQKNITCILREDEIELIRLIETNEIEAEIRDKELIKGVDVVINFGIFKGRSAKLVDIKGKNKVALLFDSFEKGFIVEMSPKHFELL